MGYRLLATMPPDRRRRPVCLPLMPPGSRPCIRLPADTRIPPTAPRGAYVRYRGVLRPATARQRQAQADHHLSGVPGSPHHRGRLPPDPVRPARVPGLGGGGAGRGAPVAAGPGPQPPRVRPGRECLRGHPPASGAGRGVRPGPPAALPGRGPGRESGRSPGVGLGPGQFRHLGGGPGPRRHGGGRRRQRREPLLPPDGAGPGRRGRVLRGGRVRVPRRPPGQRVHPEHGRVRGRGGERRHDPGGPGQGGRGHLRHRPRPDSRGRAAAHLRGHRVALQPGLRRGPVGGPGARGHPPGAGAAGRARGPGPSATSPSASRAR